MSRRDSAQPLHGSRSCVVAGECQLDGIGCARTGFDTGPQGAGRAAALRRHGVAEVWPGLSLRDGAAVQRGDCQFPAVAGILARCVPRAHRSSGRGEALTDPESRPDQIMDALHQVAALPR